MFLDVALCFFMFLHVSSCHSWVLLFFLFFGALCRCHRGGPRPLRFFVSLPRVRPRPPPHRPIPRWVFSHRQGGINKFARSSASSSCFCFINHRSPPGLPAAPPGLVGPLRPFAPAAAAPAFPTARRGRGRQSPPRRDGRGRGLANVRAHFFENPTADNVFDQNIISPKPLSRTSSHEACPSPSPHACFRSAYV